jgi:hypothetical protein
MFVVLASGEALVFEFGIAEIDAQVFFAYGGCRGEV